LKKFFFHLVNQAMVARIMPLKGCLSFLKGEKTDFGNQFFFLRQHYHNPFTMKRGMDSQTAPIGRLFQEPI